MFGGLILLTYVFVEISAVLYMGAIAVSSLLGISMFWCIVGLAVLTSIYTITGGLRAVVWTEMFQLVVLIVGGLTLTLMTIKAVGGWSSVMEHVRRLASAPARHRRRHPLDDVHRRQPGHRHLLRGRQSVHRAAGAWPRRTNGTRGWAWCSRCT